MHGKATHIFGWKVVAFCYFLIQFLNIGEARDEAERAAVRLLAMETNCGFCATESWPLLLSMPLRWSAGGSTGVGGAEYFAGFFLNSDIVAHFYFTDPFVSSAVSEPILDKIAPYNGPTNRVDRGESAWRRTAGRRGEAGATGAAREALGRARAPPPPLHTANRVARLRPVPADKASRPDHPPT
ncbi:hypothetical protein EVAR_6495_1 [Eumeta japonica]|uniref:Uncharacterized protein n=1 Tax=Eumeta variegata TaxID=151549 RepID=A0A4C1SSP4_EUMVA|nr:hypothetical protein EVAR_6495_1 [Eumeta japonica]